MGFKAQTFLCVCHCFLECFTYLLTYLQDSGNGLLETTLCFEHADQRTFRTYYVIADNTIGRRAEAVELHAGCISYSIYSWSIT